MTAFISVVALAGTSLNSSSFYQKGVVKQTKGKFMGKQTNKKKSRKVLLKI